VRSAESEGVAAQSFSPAVDDFGGSIEAWWSKKASMSTRRRHRVRGWAICSSWKSRFYPSGDRGIVAQVDAPRDPGLDDPFEEAIDEALSSLPAEFRRAISNVAILVEDEPPDGRLLGLYSGVPLPMRGWGLFSGPGGMLPATVSIFRGPITRLAAGDADRLRREVRHVVLHELAHYFEVK
jgi:predicted Zn-dependent protease with MMP-like domain